MKYTKENKMEKGIVDRFGEREAQYTNKSGTTLTAKDIVFKILGDKVVILPGDFDFVTDAVLPAPIVLSGDWTGCDGFVGFEPIEKEAATGRTGSIGLLDLQGTDPFALAAAVHEAHHALVWLQGGSQTDEAQINVLSGEWISTNIEDKILRESMLEAIDRSDESYKG